MGWAGGSDVMSGIIAAIKPRVLEKTQRQEIYREIITVMENRDWDTQDECLGEDPAYDVVVKELHPGWYDEE